MLASTTCGLGSVQQARRQRCVRESAVPPASGASDLRVGCVCVEAHVRLLMVIQPIMPHVHAVCVARVNVCARQSVRARWNCPGPNGLQQWHHVMRRALGLALRCRSTMQQATAAAPNDFSPSRSTRATMAKTRTESSKKKMLNSCSSGQDVGDETDGRTQVPQHLSPPPPPPQPYLRRVRRQSGSIGMRAQHSRTHVCACMYM